jgi:TolB-like protein
MNLPKALPTLLIWLAAALLAGCASTSSTTGTEPLDPQARWALLPMVNNTETPQAALSAESIVEHHLLVRGLPRLQHYPAALTRDSLFEPTERKLGEEALKWAREQGVRYAVSGSVEEWRYKVGLDGEPVAALTLRVTEVESGRVVWSASGSRSGWSRDGLSAVGHQLVGELLAGMRLAVAAPRS